MSSGEWIAYASLCVSCLALYRSFRQDRKLAREVIRLGIQIVSHIPDTQFYGLKVTITNAGIPDVTVMQPNFVDMTDMRQSASRKDLPATSPHYGPSFPLMLKRGQQADIYYRIAEVRNWIGSPGSVARLLASVRTTLGGYAGEFSPEMDFPMLLQKEEKQFIAPSLEDVLREKSNT